MDWVSLIVGALGAGGAVGVENTEHHVEASGFGGVSPVLRGGSSGGGAGLG